MLDFLHILVEMAYILKYSVTTLSTILRVAPTAFIYKETREGVGKLMKNIISSDTIFPKGR